MLTKAQITAAIAGLQSRFETEVLSAAPDGGAIDALSRDVAALKARLPQSTIALTFDTYSTTATVAFPIMQKYGLVGTFYVVPGDIDTGANPTTAQLNTLRDAGWEIGAYGPSSGGNFVTLWNGGAGEGAVTAQLIALKAAMRTKGFDVTSLAPTQRAWNVYLAALAEPYFDNVRAVSNVGGQGALGPWQELPVANKLNITNGATLSLGVNDTIKSLMAQIDSLSTSNALWVPLFHQVGVDSDPNYSLPTAIARAFFERIAAVRDAGQIRVTTVTNAVNTVVTG